MRRPDLGDVVEFVGSFLICLLVVASIMVLICLVALVAGGTGDLLGLWNLPAGGDGR